MHAVHFSQLLRAPFLTAVEMQNFVNNPRNWWSMDPPPHVQFLWLFGGSDICLPDSATATHCVNVFISMRTASAAARTPVNCSELHQQPEDTASKLVHLLDTASKLALFSTSDLKDEKLIKKKQTYMKTETCKLYSRDFWIFLSNIVKICPWNFELYCFNVGSFFKTQCRAWFRDIFCHLVMKWIRPKAALARKQPDKDIHRQTQRKTSGDTDKDLNVEQEMTISLRLV